LKFLEGETNNGMEPQVGTILEGKVTTITKFGAFIALEGGKSGLVHISEIANTYVNDVNDFLTQGQTVKVLVLANENGKINLSIKRTESAPARPARPDGAARQPRQEERPYTPRPASQHPRRSAPQPSAPPAEQSFEDKLKQFLSSSEGKMADLNRSMDGKRGGGRRRR
jgi:S1 RNA binding domain protein